MSSWTGFYYDGRTANRAPVTITVTGTGLHIIPEGASGFHWSFEHLRRAAALGHESVRLERGADPVETITVSEPGLPEAVRAVAPEAARRLGKFSALLDASHRKVAERIAIGTALVAFGYFIGLPAMAGALAPKIPLAWEEEMGRGLVMRMAPETRRCTDPVAQAAVESIVQRLVSAVPPTPYTFRVTLADDPVVNAFAAPGGYILVNRGLLEATRTPEELAGVLSHELQHVLRHHSTRAMVREVPIQLAITAIAGGADGIGALAGRAAGTLGVMRYHRGDESEADREGLKMLQAAKIDPQGMLDFFQTLETRHRDAPRAIQYLSSHPQTADRIAELKSLAADQSYVPQPIVTTQPWRDVKEGCGRVPAP